jgi:hypothetical protein
MDEIYATCERCGRTVPLVVVDSEDEELTLAEQTAVEAYEEWYERFDPKQDAYVYRCPDCVEESDRDRWIRIGDSEFADHTAPDYRRPETC